ncbi:MAG: hypothetical protein E6Q77_11250 [Rhizobium sp.]|nr:MAG: hypothetical protein E6Q77_11250 [Rhizobium sp.]
MRVLDLTDSRIDFPLSGGKDSRLLLGLLIAAGYRDRVSGTYTNGPEFSPEVVSAKAVAEHFRLPHRNIWNGTPTRQNLPNLREKLLAHLHLTEGEMSPIDLTTGTLIRNRFTLTGQEAGLRNIAGKRDVSTRALLQQWMFVHFGKADFCGVYTDAAAEKGRQELIDYIDQCERDGTPHEQIPSRHRVEFRGSRWVSRVWGIMNATEFAPQIFRSEIITKATYNSGARSRQLEEFHFQMLHRIDRKLVEIPFSGQIWDPELESITSTHVPQLTPIRWPEGFTVFSQRGMFGIMQDHFDDIKSFIIENIGSMDDFIDVDKLANRDAASIQTGHVAPMWQLFQCALFNAINDFGDLLSTNADAMGMPKFQSEQD